MFAVGAVVGLANGLLIVRLQLNAFIVTLAMLILLRGDHCRPHERQDALRPAGPIPLLGTAKWIGIPVSVWLAGRALSLVGVVLSYHRFGRAIYAIGGNARGRARRRHPGRPGAWIAVYVIGGLLAALAGPDAHRPLASVTSGQGQNMIFFVFAAAVIGGISLNGGRGTVFGALTRRPPARDHLEHPHPVEHRGVLDRTPPTARSSSFALILARATGGASGRR